MMRIFSLRCVKKADHVFSPIRNLETIDVGPDLLCFYEIDPVFRLVRKRFPGIEFEHHQV